MASEKDKKVQQLIKLAQTKKAEIAKAEKSSWVTNCNFRKNPALSTGTNIHTVSDTDVIVDCYQHLLEKKGSYDKAVNDLGLEGSFSWMGFTIDQWKEDFKTRITKINLVSEKKKLELLESRLDKLVSKEVREAMELEAIEKELGL